MGVCCCCCCRMRPWKVWTGSRAPTSVVERAVRRSVAQKPTARRRYSLHSPWCLSVLQQVPAQGSLAQLKCGCWLPRKQRFPELKCVRRLLKQWSGEQPNENESEQRLAGRERDRGASTETRKCCQQ